MDGGSWKKIQRSAAKQLKKRQITIKFKTATIAQFQKIPQRKLWTILHDVLNEAVAMYGKLFGVRVKIDYPFPKKTASKDVLIEFAVHLQRYLPDDAPMEFTHH